MQIPYRFNINEGLHFIHFENENFKQFKSIQSLALKLNIILHF
jgi:hypothetical protein